MLFWDLCRSCLCGPTDTRWSHPGVLLYVPALLGLPNVVILHILTHFINVALLEHFFTLFLVTIRISTQAPHICDLVGQLLVCPFAASVALMLHYLLRCYIEQGFAHAHILLLSPV